jgi:hypothetical protein
MSLLNAAYEFARDENAGWATGGLHEGESHYLAYEDMYRRKFRHWRGRSGRSYAFSVYAPTDCPAYENTVLVVAQRRGGEALACLDLGPFPEARLFKLRRRLGERLADVEFQIHVLAERQGDRQALIDDIAPAGDIAAN